MDIWLVWGIILYTSYVFVYPQCIAFTHRATAAQHKSIWRGWIRVRLFNRLKCLVYIFSMKTDWTFEPAGWKATLPDTAVRAPTSVHSPTPSVCMHDTLTVCKGTRGTLWRPQPSLWTYCTHFSRTKHVTCTLLFIF